jgi:toxin HigB-1
LPGWWWPSDKLLDLRPFNFASRAISQSSTKLCHVSLDSCNVSRHITVIIKSFRDKDTARVFAGRGAKKIPAEIVERAQAKLAILDGVESLGELRQPPSNTLHKLSGDRTGQWAIRINAEWRICFQFNDEAGDVEALEISKHFE